jgi:hypothetical protein
MKTIIEWRKEEGGGEPFHMPWMVVRKTLMPVSPAAFQAE